MLQLIKKFAATLLVFTLFSNTLSNSVIAQESNPLSQNNSAIADLFADEPEFLPVDDAFKFDFRQKGDKLILIWDIADGYYLYKDKLEFAANGVEIGSIKYPSSQIVEDEFFGRTNVYYHQLVLPLPLNLNTKSGEVKVRYQGCAEKGFCYPPTKKVVPVDNPLANGSNDTDKKANEATNGDTSSSNSASLAEHAQLADDLSNKGLLATLFVFFLLGVGLAFTPCVFPMYPILSSIIVGQGEKLSLTKAFALSMAYVQGMAIAYAALGLVVASMGAQFQAYFQHPAVLITISILFVVLAASMFGLYDLSLPQKWQNKLTNISNSQKGGSFTGVFAMGLLSGLIASPCTTAPLSGALLYVAQSGDLFVGGITLYVLSLGMGVPLLLIGTTGGKLLPKAGNWMNIIKHSFGFILLLVPLILLERFIDFTYILYIGSALLIAFAAYLHYAQSAMAQSKGKTAMWLLSIALLVISIQTVTGPNTATNFSGLSTAAPAPEQIEGSSAHHPEFIKVKSVGDLNKQLAQAQSQNKFVMLDLYADWCVACKEFEKFTFSDSKVQQHMGEMIVLQADVTANDDADIELMESNMVFGLPTILFYSPDGKEVESHRVTGFKGAEEFEKHLADLRQVN